jgi:hypothetical protein
MSESCVLCGDYKDDGVSISRCCCWDDFVCAVCVNSKSLADYVAVAVG